MNEKIRTLNDNVKVFSPNELIGETKQESTYSINDY